MTATLLCCLTDRHANERRPAGPETYHLSHPSSGGGWETLLAGDPSLGLLEIRHPEQASFTREEPQEEPRRARHPIDISHDCSALPVAAVLDYEVIAEFGVPHNAAS